MPKEIFIDLPGHFVFETAVRGHGWYDLEPFRYNAETRELAYVFHDIRSGNSAHGVISQEGKSLKIRLSNAKLKAAKVERDVRHILRLDDGLDEFYETIADKPGLTWVRPLGAGRLLRSPTVFEDMVKTMCTTNCSWSLTRKMTERLVDRLGTDAGNGFKTFPTAEAMASVDETFYRDEIKAGYRSPFFVELARKVVEGEIDPEAFLTLDIPTDELRQQIKTIKGFGDYAADNLLKLLGRYDGLALDSWLRARFYAKHNKEKKCPDKKIQRHYKRFGDWQGLAIWCDMTEDWFIK